MAELPKYQQTGRVTPDMPQLDFANVREAFSASQMMTSGLDRLSQFAFDKMGKQAEEDAIKNAILQPLTLEQIQQANQRGESVSDLLNQVGGGGIYQDTYRKIQGKQLRSELEITAQQALSSIQSQVTLGQINDVNVISSKFDSIVSGFSKPLEELSPEEAVNFKQSMAVTANTFFKESLKTLEKRTFAYNKVLSEENFDYSIDAVKAMVNTTLEPEMLKESKISLGLRVFEQALGGGEDFAIGQLDKFNKAWDTTIANKFEEIIFADGYAPKLESGLPDFNATMERLDDGDLGEASELWKEYPQDEKNAITKEVYSKLTNDYSAFNKTKEINKEAEEEVARVQVAKLLKNEYPRAEKRKVAEQLFIAGHLTQAQFDEIINPTPKTVALSNQQEILLNTARSDIANGRITSISQINEMYGAKIPSAKLSELYPQIGNADYKESEKKLIQAAGLDVDPDMKYEETRENNLFFRKGLDKKLNETNKDGSFVYNSRTNALNDLITERKTTTAYSEALTNQYSKFTELASNGFNPDNGGFEAWLEKQGFKSDKVNALTTQYRKYQAAKVITRMGYQELIEKHPELVK